MREEEFDEERKNPEKPERRRRRRWSKREGYGDLGFMYGDRFGPKIVWMRGFFLFTRGKRGLFSVE